MNSPRQPQRASPASRSSCCHSIALLLKTFSFGWMMVFIIFGPIFVMVIGYVLQVIAAAQGLLSKKGLFDAARLKRATIAAWVSPRGSARARHHHARRR